MSAFFAAAVYASMSHALAWVLLPTSVAWGAGARALVLWAVAAAALFLLRDPMATMLVTGCVYCCSRRSPSLNVQPSF